MDEEIQKNEPNLFLVLKSGKLSNHHDGGKPHHSDKNHSTNSA